MPLFYQPWWLDVVCGADNWDVVLSTRDESRTILGVLPYFHQRKFGFTLMRMPILTPYLGVIYNYPHKLEKQAKRYAFEKKVTNELLAQLPKYSYFNQHCSTHITNGQPFHWKGFTQSNQYTFQIDLSSSIEDIHQNYESSVRNEIKRGKEKGLMMREISNIDEFIRINELTFSNQNKEMPYTADLVRKLHSELNVRDKVSLYGAFDVNDTLHAAVFLLRENKILYTLMIGTDPSYRNSGAVQYLVDSILKKYKTTYNVLDFCGSMIENIEKVFRAFGAAQVPYLRVSHYRNRLFQLISIFRGQA